MKILRQRKYLFALLALLVVFGGCKGESPTAPQTGTTGPGGSPGGGTTPPVGAVLTLTTSNPTPLAGSTTTITATVSVNGNPAPNGTAVEFSTTPIGLFQDSGANTTIRTTTNGVATATLTAANPGNATVTAVVNNVSRTTTVSFQARPVTPPTPDTAPAITAINPSQGLPEGGQVVTITGRNFRGPVRVFFDLGNGVSREAIVTSSTANQIQVLTPRVDIGAGQTLSATIIVFTEQGTAAEQRITGAFTFRRAELTPRITTVSPDSGPIAGGTRITIFGDGFEHPAQVSFSTDGTTWSQMQVLTVTFNQIIAVTPTARDVNPNGSGPLTGPVDLRIININSNTSVVAPDVFRYTPAMQITAVGPTEGPFTGGTRITIDGVGFDDPVAVTVAGVAAQVVRVTGTQITAVTSGVQPTGCSDVTGPIVVTNIENGDSDEGPNFIYRVLRPAILSVSNPLTPGGNVTITVLNAIGIDRLTIGGIGLGITNQTENPDGTTTFTAVVPPNIPLETEACGGLTGVTAPIPTDFDVVYTSVTTTCTDTLTNGAFVNPPTTPRLVFSPNGFTPFSATITPAVAATPTTPATPATVRPSPPQGLNVANAGNAPLTVTSITSTGAGCSAFSISAASTPAVLGRCDSAPVTVIYNGTTSQGTQTCSVTVVTDAGSRTFTLTGTSQ